MARILQSALKRHTQSSSTSRYLVWKILSRRGWCLRPVNGLGTVSSLCIACIIFKRSTEKNLTSTSVTTSVACDSCCESTSVVPDARSSVIWDSAISTSCDSEVFGSVAQTSSDGIAPPLLRARFEVFSGAGTAGRPNNVDCFVLSLLGPRPFAALAVATHAPLNIAKNA